MWTYGFTGLPRYKKDTYIDAVYTVRETAVAGYTPATNTTVGGTVDAGHPQHHRGRLYQHPRDGHHLGHQDMGRPERPVRQAARGRHTDCPCGRDGAFTAAGDYLDVEGKAMPWMYTTAELPRYRKGTTTPIIYKVRETKASHYMLPTGCFGHGEWDDGERV